LYAATLPRADRLYLTRVHATIDGDTLFPRVDWSQWQRTSAEQHGRDEKNSFPMTFFTFERT
jgi:dihydrofolate reductase